MTTGSNRGDIPPTTPTTPTGTTGTSGTAPYGAATGTSGTTGASGTSGPSGTTDTSASTRDVAKDEARGVAEDAKESGRQTAETAKEQAGQVAEEAKSQAKQLLDQTKEQVSSTGRDQQQRAASGLRSLADELTGMVNGTGGQDGVASDLARQASDRVRSAADLLENRDPAELLQEVRRFARQRPGTFLLGAAAIGFLGGRMTRGLAADSSSSSSSGSGTSSRSLTTAPGAPSLTGTPAGDTVPTGLTGTGVRPGTEFERPAGGDAPLSGYAVPPERTGTDPHGDPTATFDPAPQSGGPGEGRI